jgi:hypothetical protein
LNSLGYNAMQNEQPDNRPRGEDHPNSKLSEAQARMVLASSHSLSVLARAFHVSRNAIWSIRSRRLWRHLEDSDS